MSKKDEALKLALEAMTYADACLKKQLTTKDKHQYAQDLLLEAGAAIREALAEQPAQEPVAICCNCLGTKRPQTTDPDWKGRCDCEPPQPAQRNPLTDEEIKRRKPISADFVSFRAGVRCMEREYRIGEKR